LKIPGPKDVGSVWPLQGNQRLVFEEVVAEVERSLDGEDPDLKNYEGKIEVYIPANFSLCESMSVIAGAFKAKFEKEKWRNAVLELDNIKVLKATFKFELHR